MNMLKMISGRRSPANPETMMKIGNALIRSKIEYGASIYGNAAKTNRQKVETLQNAFIRVSMRYLKSTPINVMLADSGQLPMESRLKWLALKETIKATHDENPNRKFVSDAMTNKKSNGTFLTDLVCEYYEIIQHLKPNPDNVRQIMHGIEDKTASVKSTIPGVDEKKANINPEQWRVAANEVLYSKYGSAKKFFTDASKNHKGTAIAAVDWTDKRYKAERVNSNISITNAELLAVREALSMAITKGYQEAVIITDSKSA